MNIDRELMSLLEDCIYQEGLLKNFKDKQANKKREKILRQRRELRAKLTGLPDQMNEAIEQARHCLKEEYSFEGVHEIMVDALFLAKGALLVSNMLEPDEIAGAKKMIAMYEPTRKKIMQMVAQRSKQHEDFPGRCEESMEIMEASSIPSVDRDYGIQTEAKMAAWTIKNVLNPYNKLMAEKQHPTDN